MTESAFRVINGAPEVVNIGPHTGQLDPHLQLYDDAAPSDCWRPSQHRESLSWMPTYSTVLES